ncbi:winged helix-turn-helix domain-containing protein [Candidatus Pelagibacter ubique]|nr:winged helix-turn-helix domain-containing protein [Candidatus Pelagibacter ubique]
MQNVFIINFNSLYEILDEIKENLSFKIIKFENEEDFEKKSDLDRLDYLVISKTDHKLLLNNNITDKNFLDFNDLPLSFKKLLELINIKLLKLKFNQQSKITIKGYELNLNSKFFSKGSLKLKLTEKEIEIILYLSDKKIKHNVADLQKNIWSYSTDMETHTVETHIYRLRKKISDLFKDEKFILSHKNGYFIDYNSLI